MEVALDEAQCVRLKKYKEWSLRNGMEDVEVRLLSSGEACEIEPNVKCMGALLCATDTAVDFGMFTRALKDDAVRAGVEFQMGKRVRRVREATDDIDVECDDGKIVHAGYIVNCAGGGALAVAHMMGAAVEYADLNFRGEYLTVEGESARVASRNIYSVPRHSEFPFLDPHYVVRADGRVEIGPTAVPVFGPYVYRGFGNPFGKLCERPRINILRLLGNPEFLILCAQEWASAFSTRLMVSRVRKFLPSLQLGDCVRRGNAGVRAALIDREGGFIKEVVEVRGRRSLHILNYNSPGATGAPAYAMSLVDAIIASAG